MSNYREIRKETAERMGDQAAPSPADERLPCRFCGAATRRATLTYLGARCQPCYEQYLSLGYSGQQPPQQCGQAAWVKEAAAKVKAYRAAHGGPVNPFAAVADRLRQAQEARQVPKGLTDDDVNAMLAEAGQ